MASLNDKGQVEGKVKAALTAGLANRYDAFSDTVGLDKVPVKEIKNINDANNSGARPVPPRSTRR